MYVAQFGSTQRALMRRAGEMLNKVDARIIGVVFNKLDIRDRRDDYYYGYCRYYQ
jgi:Mrp family chromosome partitioning ATPase